MTYNRSLKQRVKRLQQEAGINPGQTEREALIRETVLMRTMAWGSKEAARRLAELFQSGRFRGSSTRNGIPYCDVEQVHVDQESASAKSFEEELAFLEAKCVSAGITEDEVGNFAGARYA